MVLYIEREEREMVLCIEKEGQAMVLDGCRALALAI